jgi:uncharacterized protein (TIGR03437 family)
MSRKTKIRIAQWSAILATVPVVLWAYAEGPDAHHTGVPVPGAEEPTCATTGCHLGTPLNGGGGEVTLTADGGTTYTPGQSQKLTIQITDPVARVYGFQMTARMAYDLNQQAGTFTPSGNQQVLCATTANSDIGNSRFGAACPAGSPLEFVEHSSPSQSGTITVIWTPSSSLNGTVAIYVAANAANGDGTQNGDHIYTTSLVLQPSGGGGPKPTIANGGIINASQFGAQPFVAPGTWIEIYGQNLSPTTRTWGRGDFTNGGATAPTVLDGVSVTIDGQPAFVWVIGSGQINAQAPNIGSGPVQVVVTNPNGSSDPVTVTAKPVLPGLLAPFSTGGKQYLAAFVGATALGNPSAPVQPGQTVTLYGIGFGPVSPEVDPGQVAVAAQLTTPCSLTIGGVAADFSAPGAYRGLVPGNIGLYQFNLNIPDVADGDQPVVVDLGGSDTGQTLFISVKK